MVRFSNLLIRVTNNASYVQSTIRPNYICFHYTTCISHFGIKLPVFNFRMNLLSHFYFIPSYIVAIEIQILYSVCSVFLASVTVLRLMLPFECDIKCTVQGVTLECET